MNWRIVVMILVTAGFLAVIGALAPITQYAGYHAFADDRAMAGIPNFFNVISNIVFLWIGALGLRFCARRSMAARRSWIVFFAGVILVAFGSAWYHRAPTDASLVWDRIPMAVAFMALAVALFHETVNGRVESRLLPPALLLAVASVLYWRWTGDLSFYIGVQIAPFLVIVCVTALYPLPPVTRRYLAAGFTAYALSKAAEYFDHEIYRLTGQVLGGHALKHLLAAAAVFCVYRLLRLRDAQADSRAPA